MGGNLGLARLANFPWPLAPELHDGNAEVLLLFGPTMASLLDQPVPDWALTARDLRWPKVTRAPLREAYRPWPPGGFAHAWKGRGAKHMQPDTSGFSRPPNWAGCPIF